MELENQTYAHENLRKLKRLMLIEIRKYISTKWTTNKRGKSIFRVWGGGGEEIFDSGSNPRVLPF